MTSLGTLENEPSFIKDWYHLYKESAILEKNFAAVVIDLGEATTKVRKNVNFFSVIFSLTVVTVMSCIVCLIYIYILYVHI